MPTPHFQEVRVADVKQPLWHSQGSNKWWCFLQRKGRVCCVYIWTLSILNVLHGIKLVWKLESKRNHSTWFIFLKVHSQVNFKEILPPVGHGTFPLAHITWRESLAQMTASPSGPDSGAPAQECPPPAQRSRFRALSDTEQELTRR